VYRSRPGDNSLSNVKGQDDPSRKGVRLGSRWNCTSNCNRHVLLLFILATALQQRTTTTACIGFCVQLPALAGRWLQHTRNHLIMLWTRSLIRPHCIAVVASCLMISCSSTLLEKHRLLCRNGLCNSLKNQHADTFPSLDRQVCSFQ